MPYFILVLFYLSCSDSNQKGNIDSDVQYLSCYSKYSDSIRLTNDYGTVLSCFNDTLTNWLRMGLAVKSQLKNTDWKIEDEVFFNTNRSKALLLISGIDIDSTEKVDFVKIVAGEKINNSWHFYYKSYPVEYYFRSQNENLPFNREVIVNHTILNLCKDGFINKDDCSVNYNYVDSERWFKDWMREKHKEFLDNYRN